MTADRQGQQGWELLISEKRTKLSSRHAEKAKDFRMRVNYFRLKIDDQIIHLIKIEHPQLSDYNLFTSVDLTHIICVCMDLLKSVLKFHALTYLLYQPTTLSKCGDCSCLNILLYE